MNCTKCNSIIPDECKFCPECGFKQIVPVRCAQCSIELEANAKFCPECGFPTINTDKSIPTYEANKLRSQESNESAFKDVGNTRELTFTFVDGLQRNFYSAFTSLTRRSSKQSDDIHSTVERLLKCSTKRALQASVKERISESMLGLKGILPTIHISQCVDLLDKKIDALFDGWTSHYGQLEAAGKNILENVERFNLESLIASGKKGYEYKPASGIAGAGKLLFDFVLDERRAGFTKEALIEKFEHARNEALGFIDEIWIDLYTFLKTILSDNYHLNAPGLAHVKQLRIDFDAVLRTAEAYIADKNYEDVITCSNNALTQFPQSIRFYSINIDALAALERWDEVIVAASALLELQGVPDHIKVTAQFWAGYAKYMRQDFESAINLLKNVVGDNNQSLAWFPQANFALAACYGRQKTVLECIRHLKVAIFFGYTDLRMIEKSGCFECALESSSFNEISSCIENRVANILSADLLVEKKAVYGGRFFSPLEFSSKKLINAQKSYLFISEGEKILAIKNQGLLSNGKYGFCFTNIGIYWRERAKSPEMFKYSEIVDLPKGVGFQVNTKCYMGFAHGWYFSKLLRKICAASALLK